MKFFLLSIYVVLRKLDEILPSFRYQLALMLFEGVRDLSQQLVRARSTIDVLIFPGDFSTEQRHWHLDCPTSLSGGYSASATSAAEHVRTLMESIFVAEHLHVDELHHMIRVCESMQREYEDVYRRLASLPVDYAKRMSSVIRQNVSVNESPQRPAAARRASSGSTLSQTIAQRFSTAVPNRVEATQSVGFGNEYTSRMLGSERFTADRRPVGVDSGRLTRHGLSWFGDRGQANAHSATHVNGAASPLPYRQRLAFSPGEGIASPSATWIDGDGYVSSPRRSNLSSQYTDIYFTPLNSLAGGRHGQSQSSADVQQYGTANKHLAFTGNQTLGPISESFLARASPLKFPKV